MVFAVEKAIYIIQLDKTICISLKTVRGVQLSIVGTLFTPLGKMAGIALKGQCDLLSIMVPINSLFLVPIFGCLFPQNQSARSYFAMFLFAAFYCIVNY